ncbi:MAG: hypothetical protein M3R10_01640 [Verrucomicrobiota bacterium]|nr:hypothetical protein [Verrucomicrobiota bacterium]
MNKRVAWMIAVFAGTCLPLCAQQPNASFGLAQPDSVRLLDGTFLVPEVNIVTLGTPFIFPAAFGWMQPATPEIFPALNSAVSSGAAYATTLSGKETAPASGAAVQLLHTLKDNFHGEVGYFVGGSFGKTHGMSQGGYIIGETRTDNTVITVGVSYEDSNFKFLRR